MEHFWKLAPIPVLAGTTHTLVEVIHSSNREHRHGLKHDSAPGYYTFLWPLSIPSIESIPNDFDDLFKFFLDCNHYSGFTPGGRTFRRQEFSLAVEKMLLFVMEATEAYSANGSKEVR